MHIAETREQAYRDVEHGIERLVRLLPAHRRLPADGRGRRHRTCEEIIDFVNDTGLGTIGTPDDACEQIERLWQAVNGGFGAYLQLAHDWADPAAKWRSYELFARHVVPHFQGQSSSTLDAKARARAARPELAESNMKAVEAVDGQVRGRAGGQGGTKADRRAPAGVRGGHR